MKYLLFCLLFFITSCAMPKQIKYLSTQVEYYGKKSSFSIDTITKNKQFTVIPPLIDTKYKLQIILIEKKTVINPYSNGIILRLGNKKPIAYWTRLYNTRIDSAGNWIIFDINKLLDYLDVARQDVVKLHPEKKEIKKLLHYLVKNEIYQNFDMNSLHEKCNSYVDDPMLFFYIIIGNGNKSSSWSFDTPELYVQSCPEIQELKTFIQGIQLIRQTVGANAIPELERFLPENTSPQK